MSLIFGAIVFLILFWIYFLPSFIASRMKQKNLMGIFILNLFLGWTLIGWVVALIWAVNEEKSTYNE